jgi:hypothetical protein
MWNSECPMFFILFLDMTTCQIGRRRRVVISDVYGGVSRDNSKQKALPFADPCPSWIFLSYAHRAGPRCFDSDAQFGLTFLLQQFSGNGESEIWKLPPRCCHGGR